MQVQSEWNIFSLFFVHEWSSNIRKKFQFNVALQGNKVQT